MNSEVEEDRAVNKAIETLGYFYELLSGKMEEEMNRSVDTRVAFICFFYGATFRAAQLFEVSDKTPGIFYAAMKIMHFEDSDAKALALFGFLIHADGLLWDDALRDGMKAYVEWAYGSEVKPLELLAATLSKAPHITPDVAKLHEQVGRAVAVFS